MTYIRQPAELDLPGLGMFEKIREQLNVEIGGDARDPLDYDDLVLKATTPMTPVHTGSDHEDGKFMPLRRSKITTAQADPGDEIVVVEDANPFHIGDTVQVGSADGTALTDGGEITDVDYATNTVTMTNAAIQAEGDWLEVSENGQMVTDGDGGWVRKTFQTIGLLPMPVDLRLSVDDTEGTTVRSRVAVDCTIRSDKIHWPGTIEDDTLLQAGFTASTGGQIVAQLKPTV